MCEAAAGTSRRPRRPCKTVPATPACKLAAATGAGSGSRSSSESKSAVSKCERDNSASAPIASVSACHPRGVLVAAHLAFLVCRVDFCQPLLPRAHIFRGRPCPLALRLHGATEGDQCHPAIAWHPLRGTVRLEANWFRR